MVKRYQRSNQKEYFPKTSASDVCVSDLGGAESPKTPRPRASRCMFVALRKEGFLRDGVCSAKMAGRKPSEGGLVLLPRAGVMEHLPGVKPKSV